MRIGIDIRVLGKNLYSGIPEYTLNLLQDLFEIDKENEYILFYNSFHKKNFNFSWLNQKNVSLRSFSLPNKILDLSYFLFHQPKIEYFLDKLDLFFSPHFNISFSKAPKILVIHDLSFRYFPEYFDWQRRIWHFLMSLNKQIKESRKIIAVSNSTKEDIKKIFNVEDKKIKVIYSGLSKEFKEFSENDKLREKLKNSEKAKEIKKKYKLPNNFILCLGTIEPRKNLFNLAQGFCLLKKKKKFKNFYLVLAGRYGWLYKEIFRKINSLPCRDKIIFTGEIPFKEKKFIYLLAKVFVYPSFFEGFGFPPLEAMASGLPVIVSDRSSLPEIVGQSGILVDPNQVAEIAKAMEEVILDKKLREILIKKGKERVKQFDWQKTAKEYLKTFEEVKND